jgi:hypothetical protein
MKNVFEACPTNLDFKLLYKSDQVGEELHICKRLPNAAAPAKAKREDVGAGDKLAADQIHKPKSTKYSFSRTQRPSGQGHLVKGEDTEAFSSPLWS